MWHLKSHPETLPWRDRIDLSVMDVEEVILIVNEPYQLFFILLSFGKLACAQRLDIHSPTDSFEVVLKLGSFLEKLGSFLEEV
jgi:hypothetical protein